MAVNADNINIEFFICFQLCLKGEGIAFREFVGIDNFPTRSIRISSSVLPSLNVGITALASIL